MNSTDLCLVTGATGALGPTLAAYLAQQGYRVRAIARRQPAVFPFRGVEFCEGNILDQEFMRKATEGVRFVFHLAAKLHCTDTASPVADEFWRQNTEGTQLVAEACRDRSVQRLVFFSSINVYGEQGVALLNEETAPIPTTAYGKSKVAAEQILQEFRNASGEPLAVILRLASVYGPRMKENYPRLVRALSRGYFVPVGDGTNRRTLIHETDVARAALIAATHPNAAGKTYNLTDGQAHQLREIIAAICDALGRRPPGFHLPAKLLLKAAKLLQSPIACLRPTLKFSYFVEKFAEDFAVDGSRIMNELGFRPAVDLRTGWMSTVSAWKTANSSRAIL